MSRRHSCTHEKSVCRTTLKAVLNAPYLGGGGILNATSILRAPKIPLNRFRPQNRLQWLKSKKSYELLAFSSDFPNFPHLFSPKTCPYLNFEGGNRFLDPKTTEVDLSRIFCRTDATLHHFPMHFKLGLF